MSLVAHLMKRRNIGYDKALQMARAIGDSRRAKVQRMRIERGKSQMALAFDGPAPDEPLNARNVIDPTVDF